MIIFIHYFQRITRSTIIIKSTLTNPLSEAKTEIDNYINMKIAFVFNSILIPCFIVHF